MSGMKPNFLENPMDDGYYETPDPYVNAPSCNIDLLALSRYAKQEGKKLMELTREEVRRFTI